MAKPIWIDGVPYRQRRGRLVAIPLEWLGKVTSEQTITKRPSKATGKARRTNKRAGCPTNMYRKDVDAAKRSLDDET